MNQLPLLTIRQQPLQPAPKIPTRTIKAYVRENLRDFARRQAERERVRKIYRGRESPRKKREDQKQDHVFMKTIPITFRAIFEQPMGILNPMGAKLPGPQPLEVFRKGEFWWVRELSTGRRQVFERLGKFSGSDSAKQGVENSFAKRLQPWQIWGAPPISESEARGFRHTERPLLPDEICDLGDGKAGWFTAEDRTHIIHPPSYPKETRVPPAACGATGLNPQKCFVNNRANVRPSCPACAQIWQEHYAK